MRSIRRVRENLDGRISGTQNDSSARDGRTCFACERRRPDYASSFALLDHPLCGMLIAEKDAFGVHVHESVVLFNRDWMRSDAKNQTGARLESKCAYPRAMAA